MFRITRLAMTMREEAGPQLSPLAVQSLSLSHLYWVTRHMREPLTVPLALQRSPVVPLRHWLVVTPVQALASGTQLLLSWQMLSVYTWLQDSRDSTQLLAGSEQVLPEKSQESLPPEVHCELVVQAGWLPFLQVPPQSLTVVQVRPALSEQTLARAGHWAAL